MKKLLKIRVLIVLLVAAAVADCRTPTITEHRREPGGLFTQQTFTEDQYWTHLVDQRIAAEAAGQKPERETGHEKWSTFWPWWYSVIRRKPKPTWKSKQFKTSEDMVNYIKEKRRAKGLPLYD